MNHKPMMSVFRCCLAALLLSCGARSAVAQFPIDFSQIDQEMYEFVGQVKNLPPVGPGLPATSVGMGISATFVD